VVVWASATSQMLKVHLHWSGGIVTEHQITRTVHRWEQVADLSAIWDRVQTWAALGWTSGRIAEGLNVAGYRTPHGRAFTAEAVRQLRARGGPQAAPTEAGSDRPTLPRTSEVTSAE